MTVLVVAAVLLCWTPHSIILLLLSMASPTPPYLHLLSTTLLNIYTVLSPLLFAFRSRRVQRDIARLLGKTRWTRIN